MPPYLEPNVVRSTWRKDRTQIKLTYWLSFADIQFYRYKYFETCWRPKKIQFHRKLFQTWSSNVWITGTKYYPLDTTQTEPRSSYYIVSFLQIYNYTDIRISKNTIMNNMFVPPWKTKTPIHHHNLNQMWFVRHGAKT
jgi:hypothetical protein